MSSVLGPLRAAGRDPRAHAAARRARTALAVTRLKTVAAWHDATLEVVIGDDVDLHPSVRLTITRSTANVFRVGAGTVISPGLLLRLNGGTVEIGQGNTLRDGVVLNAAGRITTGTGTGLSFGTVVHADELVEIGDHTIFGEYASVVDTRHVHVDDQPVWHNTTGAPVRIGRNSWIAPRATITAGVTIGDRAVVGAGAVVLRDVPDDTTVGGVPAKVLRTGSAQS